MTALFQSPLRRTRNALNYPQSAPAQQAQFMGDREVRR